MDELSPEINPEGTGSLSSDTIDDALFENSESLVAM